MTDPVWLVFLRVLFLTGLVSCAAGWLLWGALASLAEVWP